MFRSIARKDATPINEHLLKPEGDPGPFNVGKKVVYLDENRNIYLSRKFKLYSIRSIHLL